MFGIGYYFKLAMYCELLLFGEEEEGIQLIGTTGQMKETMSSKAGGGMVFGALGFMRNKRIYMGSARAERKLSCP